MTARYTITVEVDTEVNLLSLQRHVLQHYLGRIIKILDEEAGGEVPVPQMNISDKHERNREIIQKYISDPKRFTSRKLAAEYGISGERVCQILRPVNAIGRAKARRDIARRATDEATAALRNKIEVELEAKYNRAMELVRGGMSTRQAAAALGYAKHSRFSVVLNKRLRAAGVPIRHGRFRDYSARRAKVEPMLRAGMKHCDIVIALRGPEDPTINGKWIADFTLELGLTKPSMIQESPLMHRRRELVAERLRKNVPITDIVAELRGPEDPTLSFAWISQFKSKMKAQDRVEQESTGEKKDVNE